MFNFYVYVQLLTHVPYFMYARKAYVRMHVKMMRQWKSTLKLTEGQLSASLPLTRRSSSYIIIL